MSVFRPDRGANAFAGDLRPDPFGMRRAGRSVPDWRQAMRNTDSKIVTRREWLPGTDSGLGYGKGIREALPLPPPP